MNGKEQFTWTNGERNRPLQICRPCPCGCDARDNGAKGVGYLTASDEKGDGFTVWIKEEDVYDVLEKYLRRF